MVAFVLLAAMALCSMLFATSSNSTLQLGSPDALRGRVMGIYSTLLIGTTPIGSLLTGFLAAAAGIRVTMAVWGVMTLVAVAGRVGDLWHPQGRLQLTAIVRLRRQAAAQHRACGVVGRGQPGLDSPRPVAERPVSSDHAQLTSDSSLSWGGHLHPAGDPPVYLGRHRR